MSWNVRETDVCRLESVGMRPWKKLYILDFITLLSLDNDVLETSKRRAMFCNILSQIFIVKFTYNMLITINYLQSGAYRSCYNTILNLRSTQLNYPTYNSYG